ncbi:hypothetical protein CDIK_4545, partial [Cucumispora dikerogammari]
ILCSVALFLTRVNSKKKSLCIRHTPPTHQRVAFVLPFSNFLFVTAVSSILTTQPFPSILLNFSFFNLFRIKRKNCIYNGIIYLNFAFNVFNFQINRPFVNYFYYFFKIIFKPNKTKLFLIEFFLLHFNNLKRHTSPFKIFFGFRNIDFLQPLQKLFPFRRPKLTKN